MCSTHTTKTKTQVEAQQRWNWNRPLAYFLSDFPNQGCFALLLRAIFVYTKYNEVKSKTKKLILWLGMHRMGARHSGPSIV